MADCFLIRMVSIYTASERQRMVNPRKAYPIDPGLIPVFERTSRLNLGHALESAVMVELERRGFSIAYLRTSEGLEVDFMAFEPMEGWRLIQVCADIANPATREREVRALMAAATEYPEAVPILITLESVPPNPPLPVPLRWQPAAAWLLENEQDY
jgi:uncharacterized protein